MLLGHRFACVFISIFLSNTPESDEKDQLPWAQPTASVAQTHRETQMSSPAEFELVGCCKAVCSWENTLITSSSRTEDYPAPVRAGFLKIYLYFSRCLICAASGEFATWAWNWTLGLQWHWLAVRFPAGCLKRTVPIGLGRDMLPPFLPYFFATSSGSLPASPDGILTHATLWQACPPAKLAAADAVSLGNSCFCSLKQHWWMELGKSTEGFNYLFWGSGASSAHENWRECLLMAWR